MTIVGVQRYNRNDRGKNPVSIDMPVQVCVSIRSGSFQSLLLSDSFLLLLSMIRQWQLARRSLPYGERTLVLGVLNVTPDSFSDGGQFFSPERAVAHAEQMASEGADLIDIGGESTRPGSEFVSEEEELRRVIPVIERLAGISSVPISIDTTKSSVARAALEAGAEIVNDISGLRFDPQIADEVANAKAGLILMHSRGTPKTMQQLPPADNLLKEVIDGLRESVSLTQDGKAKSRLRPPMAHRSKAPARPANASTRQAAHDGELNDSSQSCA